MLKHALKQRGKNFTKSIPYSFYKFSKTLKVKAERIDAVDDTGSKPFKCRLYLFPNGENAVFEVLIGIPQIYKSGN